MKTFLLENVIKKIEDSNFRAWFVGGCVRDQLLGVAPKDYDICTDATPSDLHKIFEKFSNKSVKSETFGVTMVLVKKDDTFIEVEISTLRKDTSSGRHPTIEFSDCISEDANRRDFTINALYEDSEGRIWDPTEQGKEDIKNRKLRFVGDISKRLNEDPLRAWRFVRFLSTKDFDVDKSILPEFYDACKSLDFSDVSKERQLTEFKKILAGKNLFKINTLIALDYGRVWQQVGFEDMFKKMHNIEQTFKYHAEGAIIRLEDNTTTDKITEETLSKFKEIVCHGTVLDHTMAVAREMHSILWRPNNDVSYYNEETRFLMMMTAFLHDIGKVYCDEGIKHNEFEINGVKVIEDVKKVSSHAFIGAPIAENICKNLLMTNEEVDFVKNLIMNHMRFFTLDKMSKTSKIWKFVSIDNFDKLVLLARADEKGGQKTVKEEWLSVNEILKKEVNIKIDSDNNTVNMTIHIGDLVFMPVPKSILTGKDLIEAGFAPNEKFKKALEIAHNIQIDRGITSKDSLLNAVKNCL